MSQLIGAHLRQNVVAYVALFFALGLGTAWALERNSVKSKHIVRGQVKSPDLKDNGVKSKDVKDDDLTGSDIRESSLARVPAAQSAVTAQDAAALAGRDIDEIARLDNQSASTHPGGGLRLSWFSYLMDTTAAHTYEFGATELRTTGTPGEFKVCSNTATPEPYVLYLNGSRTEETAEANNNCTTTFDPGADGDFTISGASILIFGVSPANTNEQYRLAGFRGF